MHVCAISSVSLGPFIHSPVTTERHLVTLCPVLAIAGLAIAGHKTVAVVMQASTPELISFIIIITNFNSK